MVLIEFIKTWILPIIDILAVAYIFYKSYNIIVSGTRADLVLKGILVIIIIYLLSGLLHLYALNLLLKAVVNYGVIALIVVFHPEIRKVLMRLGEQTIWKMNLKRQDLPVKEIIEAVDELSKTRTGALIVIKRKSGLKNIELSGITIDAIVSKELLLSIFHKNNPLHDGAVLIEGNRITAAACILPISDDIRVRGMGTRHRAAIGMTEDSDAIVLVVSEETGRISIAHGGKLKTNLNKENLTSEILKLIKEQ